MLGIWQTKQDEFLLQYEGLAVQEFCQVDDNTIVFVADPIMDM
jgi:hypothetical protein